MGWLMPFFNEIAGGYSLPICVFRFVKQIILFSLTTLLPSVCKLTLVKNIYSVSMDNHNINLRKKVFILSNFFLVVVKICYYKKICIL